ncbi:MAG TPA: SDR family NAD(P)-dependent oxidoreductase [Acidobacteriota bacterium]|jgi:NAD(P)-dependent dehydrogenase (short-subunit alcohol dehydrogenase family)
MKLKNKVAAITGAGRGIGRAAADLFAREGAGIALFEIDEKSGLEVEREIRERGGEAHLLQVDVADPESVRNAFCRVNHLFGGLHVIYNNASIFLGKQDAPVTELGLDAWNRIIAVNLSGLFHCCKYGLPLMIKSGGGSVITTASSAGVIGIPGCDAYTASKGATVSLTRSMAVEYGPRNIRVNCIAPAAIYTPMLYESNLNNPAYDEAAFFKKTPLGRYGTPEEIAKVALFLACDESSYLNGAVIVADGGITIT